MSSAGLALQFSKLLERNFIQRCKQITHLMFHKYLFATNVGISAFLSLTGDILQQNYEIIQNKNRNWDSSRTARMTAAGVSVGTICHFWYQYLDKKFPGKTFKVVVKKVAVDQVVFSPVYITLFFITTCALEKASLKEFRNEIFYKGWRLYLAEWIIWPPAQVFNFYVLPPRFRVLYDNIISLGYDVYTSYVKNEIAVENQEDKENKGKNS